MKPVLELGFVDTYSNCEKFFTDVLSRKYDVQVKTNHSPQNPPKYLIFGDPNFGQQNLKYDPKRTTKILFTGENYRPTYFAHDHAITFDHENSAKHYRLPLYVLEMWAIVNENKFTSDLNYLTNLHRSVDWEKEFDFKNRSFTYLQSNPRCSHRTWYVETLMKHYPKQVFSAGPHLNNMGITIPRDRLLKFEFLKSGKFNIAMENGSHAGYVTEKLLDAFYSNTLPLYWGSDTVHRDFNMASFLLLDQDKEFGVVEEAKFFLSMTKSMWCSVMSEPRLSNRVENEFMNLGNFINWFHTNVYKG